MVGLEPRTHPSAQADRVAKARRDLAFLSNPNEILVAHQFRDRRRHFRGDSARQCAKHITRCGIRQQPVAERSHSQRGNRAQTPDASWPSTIRRVTSSVLIGNDGLVQEPSQRHIGKRHPRRDHLLRAVGRYARQAIARARRRRLGEKVAQVVEHIGSGIDGVAIDHGWLQTASAPSRGSLAVLSISA